MIIKHFYQQALFPRTLSEALAASLHLPARAHHWLDKHAVSGRHRNTIDHLQRDLARLQRECELLVKPHQGEFGLLGTHVKQSYRIKGRYRRFVPQETSESPHSMKTCAMRTNDGRKWQSKGLTGISINCNHSSCRSKPTRHKRLPSVRSTNMDTRSLMKDCLHTHSSI